jgi:hypothetical protein
MVLSTLTPLVVTLSAITLSTLTFSVAIASETTTVTVATPTATPTPTQTANATSPTACSTQGEVNRPDWDSVSWTEYCQGNTIFDIVFIIQGGKKIRVVGNGSSVSVSDVPTPTTTTATTTKTETTTATTTTPTKTETTTATTTTPTKTETTTATTTTPTKTETTTATISSVVNLENGARIIATEPSANGEVTVYWCLIEAATYGWVDWSSTGSSGSGSWLSFRNPCPAVNQTIRSFTPTPGNTYSFSISVSAMGNNHSAFYSFIATGQATTNSDTSTATTSTSSGTGTATTSTNSDTSTATTSTNSELKVIEDAAKAKIVAQDLADIEALILLAKKFAGRDQALTNFRVFGKMHNFLSRDRSGQF